MARRSHAVVDERDLEWLAKDAFDVVTVRSAVELGSLSGDGHEGEQTGLSGRGAVEATSVTKGLGAFGGDACTHRRYSAGGSGISGA